MSDELIHEIERLKNLNQALEVAFKKMSEERDEAKEESNTYFEWWEKCKENYGKLQKEYHDYKYGECNIYFELSDIEMQKLNDWRETHKCWTDKSRHSETFSFTGNGIGTSKSVTCSNCKEHHDITDIDSW